MLDTKNDYVIAVTALISCESLPHGWCFTATRIGSLATGTTRGKLCWEGVILVR
jgi:hypothetical protein